VFNLPSRGGGFRNRAPAMHDAGLVLVVSLLLALLVRVFWRLIINLLVIAAISLAFAAIFVILYGVDQLTS
jgi:glucan phosphoethanolaminetransferase (alkaline phosphatase superfamily)